MAPLEGLTAIRRLRARARQLVAKNVCSGERRSHTGQRAQCEQRVPCVRIPTAVHELWEHVVQ
eukprot:3768166-Prymnesium_polylepis.2